MIDGVFAQGVGGLRISPILMNPISLWEIGFILASHLRQSLPVESRPILGEVTHEHGGLMRQQPLLQMHAACEPGQGPVRANYPMTGHHQWQMV